MVQPPLFSIIYRLFTQGSLILFSDGTAAMAVFDPFKSFFVSFSLLCFLLFSTHVCLLNSAMLKRCVRSKLKGYHVFGGCVTLFRIYGVALVKH